jgi:RND family efflux transporter MFP subunit
VEFSEVRAPISGRVSRALVTVGNYVSGLPGSATLLTTIVSAGPVYAYVDMDETTLLQVQELIRQKKMPLDAQGHMAAEVQLSDETEWTHQGWIESFDNRLNMDTGSTVVRVHLPNKDGKLTPGLFARVRLPVTEKRPTLLVEEAAISTNQSKKFVMTVDGNNQAQYRDIVPGSQVEGKRVIKEGLKAGEKYIVNGQGRVFFPGQPVIEDKTPSAVKNTASTR